MYDVTFQKWDLTQDLGFHDQDENLKLKCISGSVKQVQIAVFRIETFPLFHNKRKSFLPLWSFVSCWINYNMCVNRTGRWKENYTENWIEIVLDL